MATLQGKITDVTHRPPESLSSITVKAPSVRVGGGTDLIVSSPATVDFDRDTGDVTISGLTGGLSWLYLEGEGWSDSIALSVAEGMISLVEAIANASSAPGIVDYLRLLADFKIRFDETAQDAVDAAAEEIKWSRGNIPLNTVSLDELEPGSWGVSYYGVRSALNLPGTWGNILMQSWGGDGSARVAVYTDVGTDSRPPKTWVSHRYGGVWSEWTELATRAELDRSVDVINAEVVKSMPVRRIVTSSDPDEPISDGELLLVHTVPDVFFQSFTDVRTTSPRWAAGMWDVVEDSTANGSLALRGSGSSGRRLASVSGASGLEDVEVVSRIKISRAIEVGRYGGLALRASGEAGNETGYLALVSGNGLHISKFVGGSHVELNSAEVTVPENGWYWLRFRAHGTELSAKIWSDGQTEPEGWSVTANDTSVTGGGWLGPMLATNPYDNFWDVIGVANLVTGNEIAPSEEA